MSLVPKPRGNATEENMAPRSMNGRAGTCGRRLMWMTSLALVMATTGCASKAAIPPPIVSKASLGSVVIYRNGVAFFERRLPPGDKVLKLRVPEARVDDFLKSLTIVDEKTGETMPVSYPTVDREGGDVEMTIKLPKGHHGLKITYVTESPAWKPSYRLVLGSDGKAKLQAWAVVDNVSGEDWKNVRVGVGSTSALSFRYDLHSVRTVVRETLSAGSLLAAAPPTGGSPYRGVEGGERELVAVSQSTVEEMTSAPPPPEASGPADSLAFADSARVAGNGYTLRGADSTATGGYRGSTRGQKPPATKTRPRRKPVKPNGYGRRPSNDPAPVQHPSRRLGSKASQTVVNLTRQLQQSQQKVRIEGFANKRDADPGSASLDRANRLRNELIANGVNPSLVEAVGTGEVDENRGLRVVQLEDEARDKEEKAKDGTKAAHEEPSEPLPDEQPLGQAHFLSKQAMTIARDHSAMVSILNRPADAEQVYFYDPISSRGSKSFAFNAVRLNNPSDYTLDGGPFTVYMENQFLGEGLADQILPQSTAFIPYALDRNVIVEPEVDGREEIDRLVTIQRGIVTTESKKIRRSKLVITNRGQETHTVYIRHKVKPGYQLSTLGPEVAPPEKLDGAHLFRVQAPPGETMTLTLEEWTPVKRTVDIHTDEGVRRISLFLDGADLPADLERGLSEVVERHMSRADLQENIMTLQEQMGVYRQRVDELNFQLVTLKKVRTAAKLRSHLSDKMEEISDELQSSTMKLADLKARLMTERIELQDQLAELTLRPPKKDGATEVAAAPNAKNE